METQKLKKIKFYQLDFEKAHEYFAERLMETTTLSSLIMKKINFNQGVFFTLLPLNANLNNLNKFNLGGVAKNMQNNWIKFILNIMLKYGFTSIFDDYNDQYTEDCCNRLFLDIGSRHGDEIYYFLTPSKANKNLIKRCLAVSNTIWHSLCVLTDIHLHKKELGDDDLEKICLHARIIITTAYDDESYIFWKHNEVSFEK